MVRKQEDAPHEAKTKKKIQKQTNLVLEHQNESVLPSEHCNEKLEEAVYYVALVAVPERLNVKRRLVKAQAQPRLYGVDGHHPEYTNYVALNVGLVVVGKMTEYAVHRNREAHDYEGTDGRTEHCIASEQHF